MRSARLLVRLLMFVLVLAAQVGAADLTVSIIDVGQGDSILVQYPNGANMLVDAGTSSAGKAVVSYLRSREVAALDIVVATHPHEDHIGGIKTVLNAFVVCKVWDSGCNHGSRTQANMLSAIKAKGIRFETPKAGLTERIGDVNVSVLAPKAGVMDDANNSSLVLRIVYGKTSFLLTGDLGDCERQSVAEWPESTVLKVPHHGSHNGTDLAFLQQVKPKIAVISCGKDNPYGHPHKSTLDALKYVGTATYVTAESGTVVLTSDGTSVTLKTGGANRESVRGQIRGRSGSAASR